MLARRAARELAILNLFQLDGVSNELSVLPSNQDVNNIMVNIVRSLTELAKDKLESGISEFTRVQDELLELEMNADENLNRPLELANLPVALKDTAAFRQQVVSCLQGAELLWEAIELPEWVALSKEEEVASYAIFLTKLVLEHQKTLDEQIVQYAEGWSLSRLYKIDRALLRLALAEMQHAPDVDVSVTINEVVEIAKKYSTDDSYRFINGILGNIAKAYSVPLDNPLFTQA
jgi:N utilization substance protein B